jgi:hypothetical protein
MHHLISFLEKILTLTIKGKIGIKIDEIHLYNIFGSNLLFALKDYEF